MRGVRLAGAMAPPKGGSADRLLRWWPRLLRPAIADQLIQAARLQLRVNTRRSALLAEAATAIAESLQDPERLGRSLRARANALSVSGDNRAAARLHDRALALLDAHGNRAEVARTLNASIQPLILLGNYDGALAAAARARELFEAEGDVLRLARLEINVGNIYHRQDRPHDALACYDRAYAQLVPLGDVDGIISALHNKAVALILLNDFRQALATYERARVLAVEHEQPQAVNQADYNIAWLYYFRGEYSRAIDQLHATAEVSRENGDAYHAALSLLDLAEIYLELNLSGDAREVAEEATAQFRELGMGYETAKTIAYRAIAYSQEGRAAHALELFGEARALFVAEQNRNWPSLIDLYQAVVLFNEGRLFEARRLAAAALDVFTDAAAPTRRALCDLLLARIELRLGDAGAACRRCGQVLASFNPLDVPMVAYYAQFLLGQAQAALGDRDGARASFEDARRALEMLRGRLQGEELKIAFVGNKLELYEHLVALVLENGAPPGDAVEAFQCIEEAKSRTLLDLIFDAAPGGAHRQTSESELARTIRGLREELNSYYHLVERERLQSGEESPTRIARLQRQIGAREQELALVLREATSSDARQSALGAARVRSIDEIRAALPAGAVLVEFFQTHDRIVVCVVAHDSFEAAPIALMSEVSAHVRLLQFQLSKFRLGAAYVDAFRESLLEATRAHLQALFTELLAPVWPKLRGRHVVIVPHGLLHYVPFHALAHGTEYVADCCSVSYAPSASIFALCETKPPITAGPALVLGVPDERTAFIEVEAREVAAALPDARLFLGPDATADVLRTQGPSSRIVHIASHGYFRPESPMFSGIRLSDGYLTVHDMYDLDLPADLVTLSGCATGANVAVAGDELLGMSRGLFLAGARRLLLSLWDVYDESTAAFMGQTYRLISAGTPPVRALAETMREVRREYPHPYYWASFALSGRCSPI
ncbi:MAG: CHAT domain-containing protein [Acidobacteria bacterium]|nr:CHAT domain-containing protein [Acidobacteriota bacterium]